MSLTITNLRMDNVGSLAMRIADIAFDSAYPTNGESLTPGNLRLMQIVALIAVPTSGLTFQYDLANQLLKAYYPSGTPTLSGEATHTHVVTLDTGASAGEAAHTHAVALDSGASAAGSSHTHALSDDYGPSDISGVTVGTPDLIHNADPVGGLSASPIFGIESYGAGGRNILQLWSTTAANASLLGSVDDVSGIPGSATPRFWVNDSDAPGGVQIYVNESDNDKLSFVSPTATDAYIIMPFEAIANGVPGYAYAVKVHHDAGAAAYKALYLDDNGAVNQQLVFVDTGGVGGAIYAADIEVLAPSYMALAQTSGVSGAEAAHTHSFGSLADIASGVGSSHTHGPGSLGDAASAAGASHTHTATAEAGVEVGNGDNLSTVTGVVVIALGY